MRRFERRGLAGLREGEHPGRPQRLSTEQVAKINAILRQTPRDAGLGQNLWDGKALSAWIERKYGGSLGVRQCQRLFRRLEFRLRKPRPMIAKGDPAVQQQHEKTPSADAGLRSRSVGYRRSPLPATRIALPHPQ